MAPLTWLTSLDCSTSIVENSDNSTLFPIIVKWFEFILLSPCLQRFRFLAIDLVFLLALLLPTLKRVVGQSSAIVSLENPLLRARVRITLLYKFTVSVIGLLALAYGAVCISALSRVVRSEWNVIEILFNFIQAVTNVVILFVIANEFSCGALSHPWPLRVYWSSSFYIVCLFSAMALIRVVLDVDDVDQDMEVDDILSLASFPFYTFLFIVSIKGSTGIETDVDENADNLSDYT